MEAINTQLADETEATRDHTPAEIQSGIARVGIEAPSETMVLLLAHGVTEKQALAMMHERGIMTCEDDRNKLVVLADMIDRGVVRLVEEQPARPTQFVRPHSSEV